MPARTPKRSPHRKRRSIWVDDPLWDRADEMSATEAITVGHVLSVLLAAYADGRLNVPIPETDVRSGGRGAHPTTIAIGPWDRAEERRQREGIQSISVLCELLLREYVEGRVRVGITATPVGAAGR